MNWFYVEQGQQTGPANDDQMAALLRAGKINANTLVWHEGMAEWLPFNRVQSDLKPSGSAPADGGVPPLVSAAASETGPKAEAVCAECGQMFPIDEMIRHGNARICAGCKPVFMQKLSEGAPVLAAGELNYAGFGVRFGAKFIDGLIIGIPLMVVYIAFLLPMMTSARTRNGQPDLGILPFLLQAAMLFANMVYQIFFLGKYGATPGKMACKLKVVTSEGGKISYGRAAGRFFAEMLSGMICYIGYIMVAFDKPQRRALHDHICNTRVVHSGK
ncbi:MAG: RDD family protein [Verrucomicrobiota bacterium]|jgi:uncharacterized RDD family membrane protein YckC